MDSRAWSFPLISHANRPWLNRLVSDGEVKAALFQMEPDKASGPNSFPPGFFQKQWPIVGNSIIEFVQSAFRTGRIPKEANESLICLLPKFETLEFLSQFRAIALCNVIVKIVTKVLANWLQPLMSKLSGSCQSTFLP